MTPRELHASSWYHAIPTLRYLREGGRVVWGIVAALASLALGVLSLIVVSRAAAEWLLSVGSVTSLGSLLRLRTTPGLLLAGPAIACTIAGVATLSLGTTRNLWMLAVPLGLWAGVRLVAYAIAVARHREHLDAGRWSGCNILFFRPFDQRFAVQARNLVLPLLKQYGRVEHVTDPSFEAAPGEGGLHQAFDDAQKAGERLMERGSKADRDMLALIRAAGATDRLAGRQFNDAEWRAGVLSILAQSDVAVVDVSTMSDNVLWELESALRHLPPDRIILIASLDALPTMAPRFGPPAESLLRLEVDAVGPALIYHADLLIHFAEALHERMRAIGGTIDADIDV